MKVVLLAALAAIALPGLVEGGWAERGAGGGSRCREPLSGEAIVSLTNDARATEGLAELEESPLLNAIAEARAHDMLEKQYFAHISPTGEGAAVIARKVGYRYRVIAENIASGVFFTNRKVLEAWMQSPGHRRNILSSRVRELGVSVVKGRMNGADVAVCVQLFGLQSTPAAERVLLSSFRERSGATGAGEAASESPGERLWSAKRELDVEKESIERDVKVLSGDPARNEYLNSRIRAYNEKADRYNRYLAEATAARSADRYDGSLAVTAAARSGHPVYVASNETRPAQGRLDTGKP